MHVCNLYIVLFLFYISIASMTDEEEKPQQVSIFGYLLTCLKMPLEMEG